MFNGTYSRAMVRVIDYGIFAVVPKRVWRTAIDYTVNLDLR